MPDKLSKEALLVVQDSVLGQLLRKELEQLGWQTTLTNSIGSAQTLLSQSNLILFDEALLTTTPNPLPSAWTRALKDQALILVATENGIHLSDSDFLPDAILDVPFGSQDIYQMLKVLDTETSNQNPILGRSESAQQIREIIRQIAPTPVSVLITGESGVGKNLIAETIHQQSPRHNKSFQTINCGAIPETLLESELFGHEKGAFTDARTQRQGIFEAANGGTLFLDEIGEMTLSAQVRLLRVLDTHEVTRLGSTQSLHVDVRVIAATNRELQQAVSEKKFRQDLYQRLRVIEIEIPPLRSRPEDIPLLIEHAVQKYSAELNMPAITFDNAALEALKHHTWPGNVRELFNFINRLMVLSTSRHLSFENLSEHLQNIQPTPSTSRNLPVHLGTTSAESDRDLLYWAILEVAKDIKELKAFLLQQTQPTRPLPSLPIYQSEISDPGTEIEYTETPLTSAEDEIRPLEDIEREAIANALRATDNHRKKAAKLLGMAERTLYRKIQQYNL
jgi:DNA-binding NtrC family response regulator